MQVVEKINFLLQEKNMSKKEFAKRLRQISPKLYATGDIPSEQTIYRYLNGSRELKIELIPYIAEILEINEQELFTFDIEYAANYNRKYSKEIREIIDLLPHAPNSVVVYIKEQLLKYKQLNENITSKTIM